MHKGDTNRALRLFPSEVLEPLLKQRDHTIPRVRNEGEGIFVMSVRNHFMLDGDVLILGQLQDCDCLS